MSTKNNTINQPTYRDPQKAIKRYDTFYKVIVKKQRPNIFVYRLKLKNVDNTLNNTSDDSTVSCGNRLSVRDIRIGVQSRKLYTAIYFDF